MKACVYTDPIGNRCRNKGVKASFLLDEVIHQLKEYKNDIIEQPELINYNKEIYKRTSDIKKLEKLIQHKSELYQEELISKEKLTYEINKIKTRVLGKKIEIDCLRSDAVNNKTLIQKKVSQISNTIYTLEKLTDIDTANKELKELISRILYVRETNDKIELNIIFQ